MKLYFFFMFLQKQYHAFLTKEVTSLQIKK